MTEGQIQDVLYRDYEKRGHRYIVPNCGLYAWESDLVTVTKAGYVYEFEIKRTKADFRRDFTKPRHKTLDRAYRSRVQSRNVPRHFYYVCEPGVIDLEDVPEHAGLIHVRGSRYVKVVKGAPALTGQKITKDQRRFLTRGLMYRYWGNR